MANIFQQGRKKGRDLRPGWRVVALFGCEIVVVRRRQWTPEAKAGQMAEVESVGGLVSVVAQRHVFSKGLLYNWRSAGGGAQQQTRMIPIVFTGVGDPVGPLPLIFAMKSAAQVGLTGLYVFREIFKAKFELLGIRVEMDALRNEGL